MKKRRLNEAAERARDDLEPEPHPTLRSSWRVTVTPGDAEALNKRLIDWLRAREDSNRPGMWRITVNSLELRELMKMRTGADSIPDVGRPLGGGEGTQTSSQEKEKARDAQKTPTTSREPPASNRVERPRLTLPSERRKERKRIFRTNIHRWLEHNRMHQREAAERIGVSLRLLQRWAKHGIAQPNDRTHQELLRLCEALSLENVDDLWQEWPGEVAE